MGACIIDGRDLAAEIEEEIVADVADLGRAEAVRRSLETASGPAESGVVGTSTIYVDRPARGERIVR